MKTMFIILAMFCPSLVQGQIGIYEDYYPDSTVIYQNFTAINMLALLDEYAEKCSLDTIKAMKYGDEYVFDLSRSLKEMASEKQLINRGYKYRYRWALDLDPMLEKQTGIIFTYIFTKEPNFRGFMEFLRRKINEEK